MIEKKGSFCFLPELFLINIIYDSLYSLPHRNDKENCDPKINNKSKSSATKLEKKISPREEKGASKISSKKLKIASDVPTITPKAAIHNDTQIISSKKTNDNSKKKTKKEESKEETKEEIQMKNDKQKEESPLVEQLQTETSKAINKKIELPEEKQDSSFSLPTTVKPETIAALSEKITNDKEINQVSALSLPKLSKELKDAIPIIQTMVQITPTNDLGETILKTAPITKLEIIPEKLEKTVPKLKLKRTGLSVEQKRKLLQSSQIDWLIPEANDVAGQFSIADQLELGLINGSNFMINSINLKKFGNIQNLKKIEIKKENDQKKLLQIQDLLRKTCSIRSPQLNEVYFSQEKARIHLKNTFKLEESKLKERYSLPIIKALNQTYLEQVKSSKSFIRSIEFTLRYHHSSVIYVYVSIPSFRTLR